VPTSPLEANGQRGMPSAGIALSIKPTVLLCRSLTEHSPRRTGTRNVYFDRNQGAVRGTIEGIWYFIRGNGRMWRRLGSSEEVADVFPGVSIKVRAHNFSSETMVMKGSKQSALPCRLGPALTKRFRSKEFGSRPYEPALRDHLNERTVEQPLRPCGLRASALRATKGGAAR